VEKRRRTFHLRGLEVDLDEVKGLGTFLEVEAIGCDDLAEGRERVLTLLKELGLTHLERRSYLEMLLSRGA
jgi:adenylate cyclase class 2